MIKCNGRGADGDHCCYINGEPCELLVTVRGRPRCSLFLEYGSWEPMLRDGRWKTAPVGYWFAENHPGYHCGDWPQNIDPAPAGHLCCWNDADAS